MGSVGAIVNMPEQTPQALWRSSPSEWGRGRVHIVQEAGKTVCGKTLSVIGGGEVDKRTTVTCKACTLVLDKRQASEVRRQEWEAKESEREQQRATELAEWRERYRVYLRSPEWRQKSQLVIDRARGICEGCGVARATQAHHLTYEHVGSEFLWELRAVCRDCHERAHERREAER